MDPKVLEQAALALCESLKMDAAEAGLAMSEGSLAALNALAQSLGLSDSFSGKPAEAKHEEAVASDKAADKMDPEEKPKPEDAVAAEDEKKDKSADPAPVGGNIADLAKAVLDLVARMDKIEARGVATKSEPVPSAQPKVPVVKSVRKKLGEGVFANVIFGK